MCSGHAGTLKNRREYYAAAQSLISRLGDKYSEYLEPSAFRTAIRKPTKAELDYLSEQAIGTCQSLNASGMPAMASWFAALELDLGTSSSCLGALLSCSTMRSGYCEARCRQGCFW